MGRVAKVEELSPAVHGHGEFLPGQIGGADRGPGSQVAHAHGVPAGAEVERAVQEVAVDRSGERAPVSGHRSHGEQPHAWQPLDHLGGGQAAFVGDDAQQVRARARRAAVQELLQVGIVGTAVAIANAVY